MLKYITVPMLALALLLGGCGDDSTDRIASDNDSGDNSGDGPGDEDDDDSDSSGGGAPASRLPGFKTPGLVTVQDAGDTTTASCKRNNALAGGRHYTVQLTSASNETISFEVIEPKAINCSSGNPLVLHGHGFGGSRTIDPAGGFLERLQDSGHAVISIDQRGFGDSSGTVRVMDPNFEGRDLLQILDWAETHLDYLAHDRQGAGYNLVAGSTGGSYGGMYQLLLHNIDPKHRLDVLTPDITPHDLRFSLNPNGTVKSAWALLLAAGGEQGANQPLIGGLDPVIKETLVRGAVTNRIHDGALPFFYYHSARYFLDALPADQQLPMDFLLAQASSGFGYDFPALRPAKVDILFSQGMRDTLFNFNEAWNNFRGYRALGGDVRLMTHESGHILPGTQTLLSQLGPLNDGIAAITSQLQGAGLSLPELQAPGGPGSCGSLDRFDLTLAFLNDKLKPPAAAATTMAVKNGLARLKSEVCLSLAPGSAAWVGLDEIDDSNRVSVSVPATMLPVPNSVPGITSLLQPTFIPLAGLPAVRRTVAGIGRLDVTLALPLLPVNGCELSAAAPPELPVRGCDAIVTVGWGARKGSAAPRLLDEQLTPLRGLGTHEVDMVGVAEQLADGEELGLLVYGYNLQYLSSLSRDVLVPAVSITGTVRVPLLQ